MLLSSRVDWTNDQINVSFCTASYVPHPEHTNMRAVPRSSILGTKQLILKTMQKGIADAADVRIPSGGLLPGTIKWLVIWDDRSHALLACIGIPPLDVGREDISIKWHDGPDKIFNLGSHPVPPPTQCGGCERDTEIPYDDYLCPTCRNGLPSARVGDLV
jgi:hypothetical protein